jgi:hypothetical protein
MSSDRPGKPIRFYAGGAMLALGITLLIMGGMMRDRDDEDWDEAVSSRTPMVLIPVGIGLIVFGGIVMKQLRGGAGRCGRCRAENIPQAAFCRRCGGSMTG